MRDKISDADLYLWGEGTNSYAYLTLGCHKAEHRGYEVYRFAVWAPNAASVRVVGSFNGWNIDADPMYPIGETGVWEAFIGIAHQGDTYKYAIETRMGEIIYKADPFAFLARSGPIRPPSYGILRTATSGATGTIWPPAAMRTATCSP